MLGVNIALDLFFRKDTIYDKIIITRPIVPTEDYGYLPGNLKEKIDPYLIPIYETMNDVYGDTISKKNKIQKCLENQEIRILPIAFTRGISYNDAIVLVDEFQNCTLHQLEMIIGRLGKNSKLIFTGSKNQIDLKKASDSCIHIIDRLESNEFITVSNLIKNHRHEAVESILNQIRNEK